MNHTALFGTQLDTLPGHIGMFGIHSGMVWWAHKNPTVPEYTLLIQNTSLQVYFVSRISRCEVLGYLCTIVLLCGTALNYVADILHTICFCAVADTTLYCRAWPHISWFAARTDYSENDQTSGGWRQKSSLLNTSTDSTPSFFAVLYTALSILYSNYSSNVTVSPHILLFTLPIASPSQSKLVERKCLARKKKRVIPLGSDRRMGGRKRYSTLFAQFHFQGGLCQCLVGPGNSILSLRNNWVSDDIFYFFSYLNLASFYFSILYVRLQRRRYAGAEEVVRLKSGLLRKNWH